jgi:hypothetical protein
MCLLSFFISTFRFKIFHTLKYVMVVICDIFSILSDVKQYVS